MVGTADDVDVAIVQRVVPGYRVPVFERLAAKEGINLTVFHGSNPRDLPRGNTDLSEVSGFDHVAVPTWAVSVSGVRLVWLFSLLKRVHSGECDVVICPASPSILTTVALFLYTQLFADVGFIWWGKSLGHKAEPGSVGRLLRSLGDRLRRPLFRGADACLCYSTAAVEYFQSYGVPSDRTFIAYNSTDTDAMRSFETTFENEPTTLSNAAEEYDAERRDVLLFVGTHTPEKNVENLIAAHERLLADGYETTLLIAGTGPETERLKAVAAETPHVHFLGRIPDRELAKAMLITDVFTMPGHGGLAVQQAMTLGLPVVTTYLDGTERDLIDEGENGYTVDRDDTTALTDAIRRVLKADESTREVMGRRSREIVDSTVNIDTMVDSFVSAIELAESHLRR